MVCKYIFDQQTDCTVIIKNIYIYIYICVYKIYLCVYMYSYNMFNEQYDKRGA